MEVLNTFWNPKFYIVEFHSLYTIPSSLGAFPLYFPLSGMSCEPWLSLLSFAIISFHFRSMLFPFLRLNFIIAFLPLFKFLTVLLGGVWGDFDLVFIFLQGRAVTVK